MSISSTTLMMSIQAVQAEIARILANVDGRLEDLLPDDQEMLMAFDDAAAELKRLYEAARKEEPALPAYERLVKA